MGTSDPIEVEEDIDAHMKDQLVGLPSIGEKTSTPLSDRST
jgi:hypothetical protein